MSNNLNLDGQAGRMTLRRMPFVYALSPAAHWNKQKPEFSQVVNAASMAMPYLEPYLIRTMRKARAKITSPKLQQDLDLYVQQEAQHYQQHKKYNDSITGQYSCGKAIEQSYANDYQALGVKSLRFNLAYAEGFESMALAIGHMLIEQRETLFGDSDSTVASLVLWHFVEEIEHKNVAFEVFEHLYGSYFWRMVGLFYATGHIFWRSGQAYRKLLKEDGLWWNVKSRWQHSCTLAAIFKSLIPRLLLVCKPSYHPNKVPDPQWAKGWVELFKQNPQQAAQLDTARFHEPQPTALPQ